MIRFGWVVLSAGLIALGAAGNPTEALSGTVGGVNSLRTPPPKVNRRLINPNRLRPNPTPDKPEAGNEKRRTPTAQPKKRQPDTGKSNPPTRRASSPPPPPPPEPPGLPGGRPDIFPDDHAGNPFLPFFIGPHVPDILLVAMPAATSEQEINGIADAADLTVVEIAELAMSPMVVASLQLAENDQLPDAAARLLANNPGLISVSPNYYYGVEGAAQGVQSIQFAPQRMSVDEAHKIATGNSVKIAIIDTGIDDKHAELAGSITDRFDAVGAAADAPTNHGTAMAGVIAAKDQITGIAPNVEILSALAFAPPKDGEGATGTTFAIIKSMDWAYRTGARIFNLSFAGPKDSLLIKALDALADHDAIMIGAAGNAGPGKPPAYPAAHDGVIAVTATDQNDALYTMANRGAYVAVAAPGVDIITTTPGGGYEFVSGTSIATAHITGVVALVLERHPDLKARHVAQLLANASIDLGAKGVDSDFGAGLVDAVAALKSSDELADAATPGLTAGQ